MTQTFRASISQKFMDKATRLFNSSNEDIFHELLQNARRAGATKVDITYDENAKTYTVTDNGKGINDPSILLTLGDSTWDTETCRKEDPAGMGVFSLASRPCTICSNNWVISLTPEHFSGKLPVKVIYTDSPISGTIISFSALNELNYYTSKNNFKYHPLTITVNKRIVPTEPFIPENTRTTKYKGLKLYIMQEGYSSYINFHGLTLEHHFNLPGRHIFKIDVIDCPELELVLPARKELIQNTFLKELEAHLVKLVFEYYITKPHTFPFYEYRQAHKLGIHLPEATPRLYTCITNEPINIEPNKRVAFLSNVDDLEEYTLSELQEPFDFIFVEQESNKKGYSWYDAIPTYEFDEWDTEKFETTLTSDTAKPLTLPFNIMLSGDYMDIDTVIIASKEKTFGAHQEIREIFNNNLYHTFSEYDAESCDPTNEYWGYFDETLITKLDTVFTSAENANLNQIYRICKNHIEYLIPTNKVGTITIINDKDGVTTSINLEEKRT